MNTIYRLSHVSCDDYLRPGWDFIGIQETALLYQLIEQSNHPLLRKRWWIESEELVKYYLKRRACYLYLFDTKAADLAFPQPIIQPVIQGASESRVARMVSFLSDLLEDHERQSITQSFQSLYERNQRDVQYEFDNKFRKQLITLPATLSP